MKGNADPQMDLFFTLNRKKKLPKDHPLRQVKPWADQVLRSMGPAFEAAYNLLRLSHLAAAGCVRASRRRAAPWAVGTVRLHPASRSHHGQHPHTRTKTR